MLFNGTNTIPILSTSEKRNIQSQYNSQQLRTKKAIAAPWLVTKLVKNHIYGKDIHNNTGKWQLAKLPKVIRQNIKQHFKGHTTNIHVIEWSNVPSIQNMQKNQFINNTNINGDKLKYEHTIKYLGVQLYDQDMKSIISIKVLEIE